jgi:hypothetical protein
MLIGFEKDQESYGLATIPKLLAGGLTEHSYQVLKIKIHRGFRNIYPYSSQYMLHPRKFANSQYTRNENKYDLASRLSDCHHSEMSTCDTSSISLQMSCGHFGRQWLSNLTSWCPAGIQ